MHDGQEVKLNVRLTYPHSEEFEFMTMMENIDMDAEMRKDIESGDGFLISPPKNTIKKDIKNMNGIYSPQFGQRLDDINPFADRYSCYCGMTTSRVRNNTVCKYCGTKVKYVDDNFKKFAWIVLKDEYHLIHPKFYDALDYLMGPSPYNTERKKTKANQKMKKINKPSKLKNILNFSPEVDQHGALSPCQFKPQDEPYYGIGMTEFYNRFDEILDFYESKNPRKKDTIDEIRECKSIVFCHSVPVFTTHLRPIDIRNDEMYFDPVNGIYNMINKHAAKINTDKRRMNRNVRIKQSELYKMQMKYMELCEEVLNNLSGKYGNLRMLISGRLSYNWPIISKDIMPLHL